MDDQTQFKKSLSKASYWIAFWGHGLLLFDTKYSFNLGWISFQHDIYTYDTSCFLLSVKMNSFGKIV